MDCRHVMTSSIQYKYHNFITTLILTRRLSLMYSFKIVNYFNDTFFSHIRYLLALPVARNIRLR